MSHTFLKKKEFNHKPDNIPTPMNLTFYLCDR